MSVKKILISILLAVVLLTSTITLISMKVVKFKYEDGTKIKTTVAFKRQYLKEPNVKLKNNYVVEGWYTDKDFTTKWHFNASKVYSNLTLYAKELKSISGFIYRDNVLMSDNVYTEYEEYQPIRFGYTFKGLYLDEKLTIKLERNLSEHDEEIVLYEKWEMEKRELPIMTINLFNTDINDIDKENYIEAKISLFNLDEEFVLESLDAGFRGRGNSSWKAFDKKGYKIKFDKKQSLFGKEKNKHYALVAEGFDTSLTKNVIAYTLGANVFNNIEYSTEAHLIDLYINEDYHGVYLLLEHNRVDKGRVDIESNYNEIDTGYLLEYDAYAINEGEEGVDYFRVQGLKHPFLVKSPDPEDYESKGEITIQEYKAQIFYIKEFMQEAVNRVFSGNKELIEEYIDIPSLVDMYILQEFVKNFDSGWSSQYMYKKKGGKLYFGPPWDFDLTAGSNYKPGLKSPEGFYVGSKLSLQPLDHKHQLFISLMTEDWFIELVKIRIIELEPIIRETIQKTYLKIYSYDQSFYLNYLRWPDITKANIDPADYLAEQEKTEKWYYDRLDWFIEWATSQTSNIY